VSAPGDYDDGEIGGMSGRGNRSIRRKPAPVPLCPPQTPHAARTRTRGAAAGSQRLTAELLHGLASRYTDYAIPARSVFSVSLIYIYPTTVSAGLCVEFYSYIFKTDLYPFLRISEESVYHTEG
jgi:hypothetical protein